MVHMTQLRAKIEIDAMWTMHYLFCSPTTVQPSCYKTILCSGGLKLMMIFPDFVGKSVSGLDGEAAAQKLRGRVGTTVKVKLLDVFPYLELHFINYR
jgi:hypothetical protein